jgi:flavin-binding protein dodecin
MQRHKLMEILWTGDETFMLTWAGGKPQSQCFPSMRSQAMTTVAKVFELTSSSPKSIEDAIETGIKRADSTLDQIEGAWVQDIKCIVKNGKVSEWRVNMKVTFLLK